MENKKVDFHFHSIYSDGSANIEEIILEAKKRNLIALALTDHNNGNGISSFQSACREANIGALEGVEIYASFSETEWSMNPNFCGPAPDVIILGKKLKLEKLQDYREMWVKYRLEYWVPKTLDGLRLAGLDVPLLNKEEMYREIIDYDPPKILHDVPKNPKNWPILLEICQQFDKNITMQDIEKNPVRWANRHLYAMGKAAYVLRIAPEFTVERAAALADDMGGILFMAHPGGEYANWTEEHIKFFIENGGRGIEVWQYFHSQEQIKMFLDYADKYDLVISGGSDWHGTNGPFKLGCWDKPEVQTPIWVYDQLIERLP